MDRPLPLFPVLCVYIQTNKHSHTQSTYIVEKHKSEIKYSFSFSSQIHLPFATCCSSWSSPFWCSFTQSSVRVLCAQQESKKCTIQETDSPFREKLYFHPSLPLLLLLFWYFWRLEILIVWLVKCRFSSNSCVYNLLAAYMPTFKSILMDNTQLGINLFQHHPLDLQMYISGGYNACSDICLQCIQIHSGMHIQVSWHWDRQASQH